MLYLVELFSSRRESLCRDCREQYNRSEQICWICGRPYIGDEPTIDAEEFSEFLELQSKDVLSKEEAELLGERFGVKGAPMSEDDIRGS